MKNIYYLAAIVLGLLSCNTGPQNQTYKYIETVSETAFSSTPKIKELEPKLITADTDSAAYVEAFKLFCISQKADRDVTEALGSSTSHAESFKLFNEEGVDVTNQAAKLIPENIRQSIINSINMSPNPINSGNSGKASKVDSAQIKLLEKYFVNEKDEFSNENTQWYKPKSAPKYTNQNGLYCYFQVVNGKPENLRFRMQYYAEDWLFLERIQFSIDGKAYEYIPSDFDRDNGDGGHIWEWFDERLTQADKELITALANAKSAKMKLIGSQYFDVKTISGDQIKNIKRSLDMYYAMGGEY